jgi:hypothetical protein
MHGALRSGCMSSRPLQFVERNPLDFVPLKIPFDAPHAPPISLERARAVIDAAVANAKNRNWKMNVHAETA